MGIVMADAGRNCFRGSGREDFGLHGHKARVAGLEGGAGAVVEFDYPVLSVG